MSERDVAPIDYLVLQLPAARLQGKGLAALLDLTERGIIRILDLAVATVDADGGVHAVELTDLDHDGEVDLTLFEGVRTGLLDEDDVVQGAALCEAGDAVALLVYENTWAGPFVTAMRQAGAEVVAGGRIAVEDVVAALDALEAAEA